jgi:hypothetical protein
MSWGPGENNDFIGSYDKTSGDMYTFVGYNEEIFHKYEETDYTYFLELINMHTIIGMFPEMEIISRDVGPTINPFNSWSIKYFKCNEYLIMRKSGYEYIFKFDLPSDIRTMDIHKVSDTRYYFWCIGHKKGDEEQRDYYANIEIVEDKIKFHLKHIDEYAGNYGGPDNFVDVLKRQLDIYLGKFNDLDVTKFDNFAKITKPLKKYSL